jgi:hypothetical protein
MTVQMVNRDQETISIVQVRPVPTNQPCIRIDHAIQIFTSSAAADAARYRLLRLAVETGLPLLIGTDSTALSFQVFGHVKRVLREYSDQAALQWWRPGALPASDCDIDLMIYFVRPFSRPVCGFGVSGSASLCVA